jgi:hypothetical protein
MYARCVPKYFGIGNIKNENQCEKIAHKFSYSTDLHYDTSDKKMIVSRQNIDGCSISNNN